jgi:uncharacterized Zn finger protein (UPF0148 family)
MIVFDCPACKSKLQVPDEHAGKLMRCPSCQKTAPIPSADATAVAAEPIPPPAAAPVKVPTPAWDQPDANEDRDERDEDRPRRRRRRDRDDRYDDRPPPRKSGAMAVVLTLVIVGVGVCVVVPILIALLVPAVQKVREAAARTQSMNNLKQISLGFMAFHDVNRRLPFNGADANPPGVFAAYSKSALPNTPTSGSWGFQILPYVDQQPMFAMVDRNSPVVAYMCPGRDRPFVEAGGGAWTDYFYNNYLNDPDHASQPANADMKRNFAGIADGISNTIFVGHGMIPTNLYGQPGNMVFSSNIFQGGTTGTMRSGGDAIFGANPGGVSLQRDFFGAQQSVGSWGGPFPQGALMAMGDGSVHTFPYGTVNFAHFLTPCGGEPVAPPP